MLSINVGLSLIISVLVAICLLFDVRLLVGLFFLHFP